MPSYIVKRDAAAALASHNASALGRDRVGRLWCTYLRGAPLELYCSYSDDDGVTWTEEQVTSVASTQFNPSLVVYHNGDVGVIWDGLGWGTNNTVRNVQYRRRVAGVWQTQQAITDDASPQVEPSMAVGPSGDSHALWRSRYGVNRHKIVYAKRSSGSWGSAEDVGVPILTYIQEHPAVAVDFDDNVHAAWRGQGWGSNPNEYNLQYRKRTTSWQAQEAITDIASDQGFPALWVDIAGNAYCVWEGLGWGTNSGNTNIQYRQRTTSWQTQEAITDKNRNQSNPSASMDKAGDIHVAWQDNTGDWEIHYRKRESGSWQTEATLIDRATFDQNSPNLIWSLYPKLSNRPGVGYCFVWEGEDATGVTIEFFISSPFAWMKRWQGDIHVDQLKHKHIERIPAFA